MAKKRESPYRLGSPKTDNPMKEMSWCLNNRIKVNIDPEAIKEGRDFKMTGRYQIIISQGNRQSKSGFIYDKNNVTDAVFDAYRKTYQINNGKKTEIRQH